VKFGSKESNHRGTEDTDRTKRENHERHETHERIREEEKGRFVRDLWEIGTAGLRSKYGFLFSVPAFRHGGTREEEPVLPRNRLQTTR
jgi:hypothetical protein